VFVQTRELERRLSDEPEAIVPTAPPPLDAAVPGALRVTVFPDAVVRVVGSGVVVAGRVGRVAGFVATGFGGVRVAAGAGAGVSAAGVAGTSFSCGCAALSRFAIWRSRFSAVSRASEVSLLLSDTVQALNASAATIANGAPRRLIYLDMRDLD
jgi:hypothetical protein